MTTTDPYQCPVCSKFFVVTQLATDCLNRHKAMQDAVNVAVGRSTHAS